MIKKRTIPGSELLLFGKKRHFDIYHLHVEPGEMAESIILVGNPGRVARVSKYFDRVELRKSKREFITHTGTIGKKRLSVVSTGIGAANIDIVMNEIDTLFNLDFETRTVKKQITHLNFIRLGTCGGLVADLPIDSLIVTTASLGFDGVLNFYRQSLNPYEKGLLRAVKKHFAQLPVVASASVAEGSAKLIKLFERDCVSGITMTCSGFYGPQRRHLRIPLIKPDVLELAKTFNYKGERIVNLEMEALGVYGFSRMLGHHCCTVDTLIDNRLTHEISKDPELATEKMILLALERLTAS